jgi:hypothetical protein
MNTQIFFIMLVLLSFTLASTQSAGNTLFRRGDCESGGVCLAKRATTPEKVAAFICTTERMKGELLCDPLTPITAVIAAQIKERFAVVSQSS